MQFIYIKSNAYCYLFIYSSNGMVISKAKSAYTYFQSINTSKIREELKENNPNDPSMYEMASVARVTSQKVCLKYSIYLIV